MNREDCSQRKCGLQTRAELVSGCIGWIASERLHTKSSATVDIHISPDTKKELSLKLSKTMEFDQNGDYPLCIRPQCRIVCLASQGAVSWLRLVGERFWKVCVGQVASLCHECPLWSGGVATCSQCLNNRFRFFQMSLE